MPFKIECKIISGDGFKIVGYSFGFIYLLKKNLSGSINANDVKQCFDVFFICVVDKKLEHYGQGQIFFFTVFCVPEKVCVLAY